LKNQLNTQEVLVLFWDILLGVLHVHSKGIVHRDLKPENVVFDGKTLKLIDFGLSYVEDDWVKTLSWKNSNSQSCGIGTPTYASPEQLKGCHPHFSADIFSLGVILFEMLSRFSTEMERCVEISKFRNGVIDGEDGSRCQYLCDLALSMSRTDPLSRPSLAEILKAVHSATLTLVGSFIPSSIQDDGDLSSTTIPGL